MPTLIHISRSRPRSPLNRNSWPLHTCMHSTAPGRMQTIHSQGAANCQHSLLQHRRGIASCSFRNRLHRRSTQHADQHNRPCKCRNSAGDSSNGSSDGTKAQQDSGRIANTLAGLDLLLGVQPEKEGADKDSSQVTHARGCSSLHKLSCWSCLNQHSIIGSLHCADCQHNSKT